MVALLEIDESNVKFNGEHLSLDRRQEIPGHSGYFFQVCPVRPGERRQPAYILRILLWHKLVRSETVVASYDPIKLELHPNKLTFPLSPVIQRLVQAGIRIDDIHRPQLSDSEISDPFPAGTVVHALTDGSSKKYETYGRDMVRFWHASWGVVCDNASGQVLAVYLWDHAAERDLTELYNLVAEPTR